MLAVIALLAACAARTGSGAEAGEAFRHADGRPSHSAPLALTSDERSLWVVNPDADSVTEVDLHTLEAKAPVAVGREPWSVVVTGGGVVITANRADGTLTFLEDGEREDLNVGAEPAGIALSPSGRHAYVTLSASGEVAVVDVEGRAVVDRIAVASMPWAIAVSDDSDREDDDETVVVTHRLALPLAPDDEGERQGRITLISDGAVRALTLPWQGFGLSPKSAGNGFANALEGLALQGDLIYLAHSLNDPGPPRTFNTSVSAGVSVLPLIGDDPEQGLHLNDPNFSTPVNYPRSIAVSPRSSRAYVALAGSNTVMGIDMSDPAAPVLIGFWAAGANPRGIVVDSAGERAYVMNYLSRDVSVLDLTDTVARPVIGRIPVAPEVLGESELLGKRLFNDAVDPRMSRLGWISCASCHLDGGGDGTSWETPEGLRQTIPLWLLSQTLPLHASATRDEVQDFEGDIEVFMRGVGLAPGEHSPLLEEPNAGRSAELDALADFVLDGFRVPSSAEPVSPELVQAGRLLFEETGCTACHGGPAWSSSTLPAGELESSPGGELLATLVDVGTYEPEHDLLGENGFDPPTLLGLHSTAPYLHDGSASTLAEVLRNRRHTGVPLDEADIAALAAFLATIDADTTPFLP